MKSIFTLVLCSCFIWLKAQPPSTDSVLQEACAKAANENKNVFVIFHASWCIWCRKMDSAMNDPAVKKSFEKNYVITHLTILESADKKYLENPGAIELYSKYAGSKGQGIPFWIIFDKNGKFLADAQSSPGMNTGCPATREEVQYFISVLKKTSKISNEQLLAIEKRFRKNE